MQADTVAAIAACAAAGLSLVNVGYQAYLSNRADDRKWLRESLPEALLGFARATHEMQRLWFLSSEKDRALPVEELQSRARDHTTEAFRWQDRLELIANPGLLMAAHEVSYAIDAGRMYLLATVGGDEEYDLAQDRELYWQYAEASHSFLIEARVALGLAPPSIPPGLSRWRESPA